MAKAGGETTTWISYSQAKALASEYLGDPDFVEREIRRGLAAGEISWQCARFEAPPRYSRSGAGDPEFWKFEGQLRTRDGSAVIETWRDIYTEGDSAIRTDDTAAYGIRLDHNALVRLRLLPAGSIGASPVGKNAMKPKDWLTAEVKRIKAARETVPSGKTEFARLLEGRIKAAAFRGEVTKPIGFRHIVNNLGTWKLWPIPPV